MIPISSVDRIIKEALFEGSELPTSSKAFMQACLSKFITHLTMVRPMCFIRLVCANMLAHPLGFSAVHLFQHPWLACLVQGALVKCERENRKSITADDLLGIQPLHPTCTGLHATTPRHRSNNETFQAPRSVSLRSCTAAPALAAWCFGCLANLCPV